MENNNNNPLLKSQGKDKHLRELEQVRQAFYNKPKTMKEVDLETGVMRESICWYCRTLRQQNQLYPIKQRRCSVTGYPLVWEWTTNPELVPPDPQLSLF